MIDYDPGKDARELAEKEMRQRYRNVFGSLEGRIVLRDILSGCHFAVSLNSEEERIRYNVGIAIAHMSGIVDAIDQLLGIGEV